MIAIKNAVKNNGQVLMTDLKRCFVNLVVLPDDSLARKLTPGTSTKETYSIPTNFLLLLADSTGINMDAF